MEKEEKIGESGVDGCIKLITGFPCKK